MAAFCDGSGVVDDLDADGFRKYWRCKGCDNCKKRRLR